MVHIKAISVQKANSGEDNPDPPIFSVDQLLALLGGSVQEVLLSVIEAKGKTNS